MKVEEQRKAEHQFKAMAVELHNYFIDRIVKGEFDVKQVYLNSIDVKIIGYQICLIASPKDSVLKWHIQTFSDTFMELDFEELNEEDRYKAWENVRNAIEKKK
jgi:hypothetical protein